MTEEKKEEKPKKKTRSKKKQEFTEEELASPRTPEQFRMALRRSCKMYYDIQEMRIQTLGRLMKKAPGAAIELHPQDLQRLQLRLTELETVENHMLRDLKDRLKEVPFYQACILPERKGRYKGLGPRMASVILSSFDIAREETVSQMWAFAGLAPVPTRRCKHCFWPVGESVRNDGGHDWYKHPAPTVKKETRCKFWGEGISELDTISSGRAQRPVAGEKLNYNAWLRAKLCGVLAEVLIKCGSSYRKFYDNYKFRWEQAGKGVNKAHRHAAAKRYMIKMFLLDIYKEWRTFEGLSVRPSYQEEYLGHTHHVSPPPRQPIEYEEESNTFDSLALQIQAELDSLDDMS